MLNAALTARDRGGSLDHDCVRGARCGRAGYSQYHGGFTSVSSWNVGQVVIGSTTGNSNWDNPCNGHRHDGRVGSVIGYADEAAARRALAFHCQ